MEILGLLDALESMVLDGFKIPLTGKTLVKESELLNLIDKIRLVAEGGQDFVKKKIGIDSPKPEDRFNFQKQTSLLDVQNEPAMVPNDDMQAKVGEVMQQAYQIAKEVRTGADKYADEVLINLESTAMRILRTIKAGRERLSKSFDENTGSDSSNEENS